MKLATALALGLALVIGTGVAGCNKKKSSSGNSGNGKSNMPGDDLHGKGPHGGFIAEPEGHKFRVEIAFKTAPKTLEIFFYEHDENKPLPVTNDEIVVTDLKDKNKKKLANITLKKVPVEGETEGNSHFKAEGDALKEIADQYDLNGARFRVKRKGIDEEVVTIKRHKDDHDH